MRGSRPDQTLTLQRLRRVAWKESCRSGPLVTIFAGYLLTEGRADAKQAELICSTPSDGKSSGASGLLGMSANGGGKPFWAVFGSYIASSQIIGARAAAWRP